MVIKFKVGNKYVARYEGSDKRTMIEIVKIGKDFITLQQPYDDFHTNKERQIGRAIYNIPSKVLSEVNGVQQMRFYFGGQKFDGRFYPNWMVCKADNEMKTTSMKKTKRIDCRFEVGKSYYAEFGHITSQPYEVFVLNRTAKYVTFLIPWQENRQVRAYVHEYPQLGGGWDGQRVGTEGCEIESNRNYRQFQVFAFDETYESRFRK